MTEQKLTAVRTQVGLPTKLGRIFELSFLGPGKTTSLKCRHAFRSQSLTTTSLEGIT
jgi:hypothetical protein